MNLTTQKRIFQAIGIISILVSIIFTLFTINEPTRTGIETYVEQNVIYSYLIVGLLSFIATVIPPISTAIINILAIQYFGWVNVLIFSSIGNIIGYTLSFLIARRFKSKVSNLFDAVKKLQEWEKNLSDREEFIGVIFLRIAAYVVGDYMSYALGISNVKFRIFITATLIGELISQSIVYYLANLGYNVSPLWFLTLSIPFAVSYYSYYRIVRKK